MRAVQIQDDADRSLRYRDDLPEPETGENELLIRVIASPINPSDVMNKSGAFHHTTLPRIPGRDFAGIVHKAHPGSRFQEGATVYGTSGPILGFARDGAHAEFVVAAEDAVAAKPQNLSFAQAAACGVPFTTAHLALKQAHAKQGEVVLVLGAVGSVGSAVCQIARVLGCKVIDAARRSTSTVNMLEDPNLDTVTGLNSGKGVDVCVDTVGTADSRTSALKVLADFGRLAVIIVKGEPEVTLNLRDLYRANHSIVGCNSVGVSAAEMAQSLAEMTTWFEDGQLTAPDETSFTKVDIADLKAAYEDQASGKVKGKKYMLGFSESN